MSSSTLFRLAGTALVVSTSLLAVWTRGLHAEQQVAQSRREPVQAAGESGSFVADLVVRHRRFDDNGRPVGEGSDVSYTLTRQRRGGQWITSMDVRAPGLTTIYPDGPRHIPNRFAPVRIEQAEGAEEALWLIDADGNRRKAPTRDELEALTTKLRASLGVAASRESDATLDIPGQRDRDPGTPAQARSSMPVDVYARADHASERRATLARDFGEPRGRVGGFDRYVRDDEAGRTEVLVDPQTALPAEIHSSNPAGDQTFIEARYERDPGRGHVRRLLRSEQRFVEVPGTTVTEVEVTRLVVGDPVQQ